MATATSPDFTSTSGYQQLYKQIFGNTGPGGFKWDDTNTSSTLSQMGNQFSNLFSNLVGRAPTSDEANQMFNELGSQIGNSSGGFADFRNNPDSARNTITQYIGDTFQPQAKAQAQSQMQQQAGQAQSLSDLFRKQGTQAISSTESALKDYASSLFERLRPQLMTSLQSQGLLDTGGLNEAMAGAQKDLAASSQGFLADANLNMQNQANQIAFAGAAAPYQYNMQNLMNQVPYLQGQGQGALDMANNGLLNSMNFSNQMALLNRQGQIQSDLQPSMLQTMGQSFANSFGKQAGQSAGFGGTGALNGGLSGFSSMFGSSPLAAGAV